MRVIDIDGNDIINPDLNSGYLIDWKTVRNDASPIDNVTKFTYEEADYELVQMYIEYAPGEKEALEQATNIPGYEDLCGQQASSDDAVCTLYEISLKQEGIINDQDSAICALYELVTGGV